MSECGVVVLPPGDPELLGAAMPAPPAQQLQGVHPERSVLDHLQHHRRQQSPDPGESKTQKMAVKWGRFRVLRGDVKIPSL